jgi:ATP-dependent protease ClpP protease subunit
MSKRKLDNLYENDNIWGNEIDYEKQQEKKIILLDEHFVYTIGNEIHFTTGVNRTSIQTLIKQIMEMIMEHKKKTIGEPDKLDIVIIVDSPGGSISSVLKFCDFLDMCRSKFPFVTFTSVISGSAASAGTIMSIYCDKRYITRHATAMVHELRSGFSDKMQEITSYYKHLTDLHNKLANIYVERTKLAREEIEKIMRAETWYTAEEYKKLGFVDDVK